MPPGAARRPVTGLDVAQTPADLGLGVVLPVGAGRWPSSSREAPGGCRRRWSTGWPREGSSRSPGSTASRGSRTGPGSSRTRRASPERCPVGRRWRAPRSASPGRRTPATAPATLARSTSARRSDRATTRDRSASRVDSRLVARPQSRASRSGASTVRAVRAPRWQRAPPGRPARRRPTPVVGDREAGDSDARCLSRRLPQARQARHGASARTCRCGSRAL